MITMISNIKRSAGIIFFVSMLTSAFSLLQSCNNTDDYTGKNPFGNIRDTLKDTTASKNKINKDSGMLTLKTRVLAWNAANNAHAYKLFENLYADEVDYYGTVCKKQDAILQKEGFFKKHPGYKQSLEKNINIIETSNGNQAIEFIKDYSEPGVKSSVKSVLIFQKFKDDWKIVSENDANSLKHRTEKKDIPMSEKEITSCDKAAEAIFLSADDVQNMLIKKYVKYNIEFKPGDKENTTKNYCFWVFAEAPNSGHTETYGRFQVDPKTGQLYEYDTLNDNLHPVPYNTALVKYLKKFCR